MGAATLVMHVMRSGPKKDTRGDHRNASMFRNICLIGAFLTASLVPFRLARSNGAVIMSELTKRRISARMVVVGLVLGLSACSNPYDPVQRTIGGGLLGAGSGAAIGAAAAGGHGAALGAAVGGAVGAVGGLITTPPPPQYRY